MPDPFAANAQPAGSLPAETLAADTAAGAPDTAVLPAATIHLSDAPQRQLGTRSRSGNAMERTRTAILAAAARCVAEQGVRRTTMADVSSAAGIAKATLYNHFRTKPDLLAALVDERVAVLAGECLALAAAPAGGPGLQGALNHAASTLATSPPLRRVATDEPALLVPLVVPGDGRGWFQARAAIGDVLVAAGLSAVPEAVDVVLRWLVGQLLWPLEADLAEASAALLAAGVGTATAAAPEELQPS